MGSTYLAKRTFIAINGYEVYQIYQNEGYYGFVLPTKEILNLSNSSPLQNFILAVENLSLDDGPALNYLRITPSPETETEVFDAFVFSFLSLIADDHNELDLIETLISAYEKWRDFFQANASQTIKLMRIIGLFGELYFLRDTVKKLGPSAISSWWGPFRNRNDFEFERTVVEVKSTLNLKSLKVTVNGLNQFQDSYERGEYLILLKFTPADQGSTIADLMQDIVSLGVSESEIENRMSQLGSISDILTESNPMRLVFVGGQIYQVDLEFPLVRRNLLPLGTQARISGLSYTLDLEGLTFTTYTNTADWIFDS